MVKMYSPRDIRVQPAKLFLIICLSIAVFSCLPPNTFADEGKICGTTDIRSFADNLYVLDDCHVIEGNLSIALIDKVGWGNFQGSLTNLVEITGTLLLFRVEGLRSLGELFPNLVVIGGQTLFIEYALVVYEMFDLESIGLSSLTVIRNGAIRFEKNPLLCYTDTVDWGKITTGVPASKNYFKTNKVSHECANVCPDECGQTEGISRCWDAGNCQKMLACPKECMTGFCIEDVCCHPECVGGCSGPLASECHSCKNVKHIDVQGEETCMPQCPDGFFMFENRRCLTAEQCLKVGHSIRDCNDNECMRLVEVPEEDSHTVPICSVSCPPGYEDDQNDATRCIPCENGKCRKVCSGKMIDNLNVAEELKDCNIIDGPLVFRLRNCVDEDKLEEFLSGITEVTGYIDVSNSHGLHSLRVLKNLRKIGGQQLVKRKYVMYVTNNPNLYELFPGKTLAGLELAGSGSALFLHNGKLSFESIEEFLSKTDIGQYIDGGVDIIKETNGNKISVSTHSLQLQVLKVTPHVVFVQWPSLGSQDSDNLIGYSLHWKKVENGESVKVFPETDVCYDAGWDSKDIDCVYKQCKDVLIDYVVRLKPFTQYVAYVRALTLTDDSAVSNVVYFKTAADVPSVPLNLRVNATAPGTLHLTWNPPAQPNGIVSNYKVYWRRILIKPEEYMLRDFCVEPLQNKARESPLVPDMENGCCPCHESSTDFYMPFQYILQNTVYIKRAELAKRTRPHRDISDTKYRSRRENGETVMTITNAEELTLTNLGNFKSYAFEIVACHSESSDQDMLCSESAFASGKTQPDATSDLVSNVSVEGVTDGFRITWQDPLHPNGLILTYDIEGMETNLEEETTPTRVCIPNHNVGEKQYTFSKLERGNYMFRIRASSLAGMGPWTQYWHHTVTAYECHHWTQEDYRAMGGSLTPKKEKARCEGDLGYVFTQGDNENYRGCKSCWCCKPRGA